MTKRDQFIAHLTQKYPKLEKPSYANNASVDVENLVSENMISEFTVQLPLVVLEKIQKIVKSFYKLRNSSDYQKKLFDLQQELKLKDCHHHSVMMSYDFHITEGNEPRLIEINTNAAFHILGLEMYEALHIKQEWTQFTTGSFKNMILNEVKEAGIKHSPQELKVAIFDETPEQQRLFIEFLVYQQLFESFGWQADILDVPQLSTNSSYEFIYNRHTDFYFKTEQTKVLRELSFSGTSCVSPHPFEYLLLADKERMILWNSPQFYEELGLDQDASNTLRKTVPLCYNLSSLNAEEIWQQRKKLFIKPMRAFGSKQSYRGSSVSKKIFDQLVDQDMVAQEFLPAPEIIRDTPTGPQSFKYDLRCYVYKDELQSIVARVYQGQVTNLRTPLGGFAPVIFS